MNVSSKGLELAELRRLPNVFMLGAKPADAVPQYMQHFDVCLMCYEINDYTKYISPLKLNEYLATGQPVVSSPINSVKEYSDVVALASSDAEYAYAIEQSLGNSALAKDSVAARQRIALEHDWGVLVGGIADLFEPRDTAGSQSANRREMSPMSQRATPRPAYMFVLPWELHVVGGVNGVVRNLAMAMLQEGSLEPSI